MLICLAGAGCGDESSTTTYKQSRVVMGTFAEVTAVAPDRTAATAAVEAAYDRLELVNRLMSDYRDDSEVGRLNALAAGQSLVVSPETFHVLEKAAEVSQASGGAFDVTCRPLVSLWKQAGKSNKLPGDAELAVTRKRVGWQQLALDPATRTVTIGGDSVRVDLGGIAKGYSLDLAASAMRQAGAVGGLVNVGGDVVAFGTQAGGLPWRIGIRHPFENGLLGRLKLVDCAVATSGDQQRFSIIEGQRFSHIVDPRTGRPAAQAPAVTVIAPDGITADAWATALSVLRVEEGRPLVEQLDGVEARWFRGSADRLETASSSGFASYVLD